MRHTHGRIILGYSEFLICHEVYGTAYTSNRKSSYKRNKELMWERQKGICYWCGKQCTYIGNGGEPNQFTIDHIIPLCSGGSNHWRNEVGSCFRCNNARNQKWQFVKLIELEKVENECTVA